MSSSPERRASTSPARTFNRKGEPSIGSPRKNTAHEYSPAAARLSTAAQVRRSALRLTRATTSEVPEVERGRARSSEVPEVERSSERRTSQSAGSVSAALPLASFEARLIIASSPASHSPTLAKTVLSWFYDALTERTRPLCQLYLASDMKGHRNATSVLILPDEDGFEFITSRSQAKKILGKYFDR